LLGAGSGDLSLGVSGASKSGVFSGKILRFWGLISKVSFTGRDGALEGAGFGLDFSDRSLVPTVGMSSMLVIIMFLASD
jgi:hypothetical protein